MTDTKLDAARIEELLPCPFCGVRPFADVQNGQQTPNGEVKFVWCEKCDSCGPERLSDAEAIAAWNRRTPALRALSAPEPVAYIEREVLAELGKHRDATGTVASGLLKKPFGDPVALYASPSNPPRGEVKALKWFDNPNGSGGVSATTQVGIYSVDEDHKLFAPGVWPPQPCQNQDGAKAAAQAHFDAAIRAALKPIEPEVISEDAYRDGVRAMGAKTRAHFASMHLIGKSKIIAEVDAVETKFLAALNGAVS